MSDNHDDERKPAPQDVVGGLSMIGLAGYALYLVNHLPAWKGVGFASGTAPRIFAYGLGALGLVILIEGLMKAGPKLESWNLRGPLTIVGSILLFGFGIRYFGLAIMGVVCVLLCSFATPNGDLKKQIPFAVIMTIFCILLFPIALNQPIPLWPTFGK